jgi:hypothetical protein
MKNTSQRDESFAVSLTDKASLAGGLGGAATIVGLLTPDDCRLFALYTFDRLSQVEIGQREQMPQPTVSWRIRRATRLLAQAGVVFKLPGRGRRRSRIDAVRPGDDVMSRLTVADGVGSWTDGRRRTRRGRDDD